MTTALVQILRIVAVVALLCASAALATPNMSVSNISTGRPSRAAFSSILRRLAGL